MIDVATQKPVEVKMALESGPYLDVSTAQLDKVRAVLDASGIKYWVDDSSISVNGAPPMTYVWIHRKAGPHFIQARLDEAA